MELLSKAHRSKGWSEILQVFHKLAGSHSFRDADPLSLTNAEGNRESTCYKELYL